jgi:hypothetical protein
MQILISDRTEFGLPITLLIGVIVSSPETQNPIDPDHKLPVTIADKDPRMPRNLDGQTSRLERGNH